VRPVGTFDELFPTFSTAAKLFIVAIGRWPLTLIQRLLESAGFATPDSKPNRLVLSG